MERNHLYALFGEAKLKGWEVDINNFPDLPDERFYPKPLDLFKALELIRPDAVRYLVLGQDPYFTASNDVPDAIGIAFALNSENPKFPPSLQRILKHIHSNKEGKKDLTDWITCKGVLLLNAALTVPANNQRSSAGKHLKLGIWDEFVIQIIKQLLKVNPTVKMIAWGIPARDKLMAALIESKVPYTWCYHPVASKTGINSYTSFWQTELGLSLKM